MSGIAEPLGSRYLLEEEIGRGGMGVVWRGRDRDGASYAIKIIRPELVRDSKVVARFVQERTVLTEVRHPNMVTVHDMIVEGDRLALVMDLIEGQDLAACRERRGGTLPPAEAARLTAQVCDALAAAHAAGIVHRDVKPSNVLLAAADPANPVRLADFGIAHVAEGTRITSTNIFVGTASYLAPEIITGGAPGPGADIYAVGMTLYELLLGRTPFVGAHPAALMHNHLYTRLRKLPGLPDPLWPIIESCVAKDPAARPDATRTRDLLVAALPALEGLPAATPLAADVVTGDTPAAPWQSPAHPAPHAGTPAVGAASSPGAGESGRPAGVAADTPGFGDDFGRTPAFAFAESGRGSGSPFVSPQGAGFGRAATSPGASVPQRRARTVAVAAGIAACAAVLAIAVGAAMLMRGSGPSAPNGTAAAGNGAPGGVPGGVPSARASERSTAAVVLGAKGGGAASPSASPSAPSASPSAAAGAGKGGNTPGSPSPSTPSTGWCSPVKVLADKTQLVSCFWTDHVHFAIRGVATNQPPGKHYQIRLLLKDSNQKDLAKFTGGGCPASGQCDYQLTVPGNLVTHGNSYTVLPQRLVNGNWVNGDTDGREPGMLAF